MEIIFIFIAILIILMFIKYLLKKIFFMALGLGIAGIISFLYKVPYIISLCSIMILIYSINSIFSEIKYMVCSLVKPCRFYRNGFYEKIVTLLFSMNYIIFMSICYIALMSMSFSMIDIVEIATAFSFIWICVWLVMHTRTILFKVI